MSRPITARELAKYTQTLLRKMCLDAYLIEIPYITPSPEEFEAADELGFMWKLGDNRVWTLWKRNDLD